jgi:hypothetical protein
MWVLWRQLLKRLIIFLGLVAGLALAGCSGSAPEIALGHSEQDLGEVQNGEIRSLEVDVLNSGSSDLVINAVSTSCGCTTAKIEPMEILPGEKGLLTIEYDSGAHGPEFSGQVIRQIFVASNDPEQPEVEFRITAEVVLLDQ